MIRSSSQVKPLSATRSVEQSPAPLKAVYGQLARFWLGEAILRTPPLSRQFTCCTMQAPVAVHTRFARFRRRGRFSSAFVLRGLNDRPLNRIRSVFEIWNCFRPLRNTCLVTADLRRHIGAATERSQHRDKQD